MHTNNQQIFIPWESQIFQLQSRFHCQKQIGREHLEVTLPAEAFNGQFSFPHPPGGRDIHSAQTLAQFSQNRERTYRRRTEGSISKPAKRQRRANIFGNTASRPKALFLKNLLQQQNLASLFFFFLKACRISKEAN